MQPKPLLQNSRNGGMTIDVGQVTLSKIIPRLSVIPVVSNRVVLIYIIVGYQKDTVPAPIVLTTDVSYDIQLS